VNRARRPPLQHPLAQCFEHAVDSLGAALHPDTVRHYRGTARKFLSYLGGNHPDVRSLDQRLDPVKLDLKHYKVVINSDQVRVLRANDGFEDSVVRRLGGHRIFCVELNARYGA
jgi:hypothetical protein